mmetsp:Transcript_25546/g.75296  ORF Transcript_25546/g.75296 Transcript_25546/m.75296 type:complete len:309 (-) Transcript_25546:64-990(-)
MRIAVGRQYLEDSVLDGQDRDVECTPAEIEHQYILLLHLLLLSLGTTAAARNTVRHGRGGGFVDDALHAQSGDDAGVPRGVTLRVVKIRGDRDDRSIDGTAQIALGVVFQLRQYHGGYFFRGVFRRFRRRRAIGGRRGCDGDVRTIVVAAHDLVRHEFPIGLDARVVVLPPYQSLHVENGIDRVQRRAILGGIADQPTFIAPVVVTVTIVPIVVVVGGSSAAEGDVRRSDAIPLIVRYYFDLSVTIHCDAGIGRPEIDSDDGAGPFFLLLFLHHLGVVVGGVVRGVGAYRKKGDQESDDDDDPKKMTD